MYSWRDLAQLDSDGCFCDVGVENFARISCIWNEVRIDDPQADANGRLLVKLHKQQLQLQ